MFQPNIKGTYKKKPLPPDPIKIAKETKTEVKQIASDFENLKTEIATKIEALEEKTIETSTQLIQSQEQAIKRIENSAQEVLEAVSDGKTPIKGEDYFDGKDADEDAIIQKVLEALPEQKEINPDEIVKQVLDRIPQAERIDEKKLILKIIRKLPEKRGELRIIKEKVDTAEIIEKLLENEDLKFKVDKITGLEDKVKEFWNKYPRGYLHGGGQSFPPTGNISMGSFKIISLATPTLDTDAATKKYVDDAVGVENLWDRTGTTLSPHTAGDKILTTGSGSFGDASAKTAILGGATIAGYFESVGAIQGALEILNGTEWLKAYSVDKTVKLLDGAKGISVASSANGFYADIGTNTEAAKFGDGFSVVIIGGGSAATAITVGDLAIDNAGNIATAGTIEFGSIVTIGGTAPVADGTYTVGLKLTPVTGTDGTITVKSGIITAITAAT